MSSVKAFASSSRSEPSGPCSACWPCSRSSGLEEMARAKTASLIAFTGTPSFSADCTVQVPVPFMPARSTMTSTSGLPVRSSRWRSTSEVISMR